MTILIGYVPTPSARPPSTPASRRPPPAATTSSSSTARAAAPPSTPTSSATTAEPSSSPGRRGAGVTRAGRPRRPRRRHRRRRFESLVARPAPDARRHRAAAPQPRRQARHGQRRPAAAARARRPGPRRQARVPVSPSASPGSSSPRSRSRDPPLLNVVGVHQPWALRAIVERAHRRGLLGLGETYADEAHLARLDAVATALPGHDPYDLQRPAAARRRRARPRDRRGRRQLRRHARRRLGRRHRLLAVRGRLPRPRRATRPAGRSATCSAAPCARPGAVQRLPLLQVGRPPRLRGRRLGRGARPRPARRPGAPDGRRLGLRLAQAQGRGAAARPRSARRSRRCATAFPDLPLRLDPNGAWTAETSRRGRRPRWPASSSTSRTRRPASRAWPRVAARHRRAARDQHVRHRLRAPAARGRRRRRAGRAVRPPPLGRAAALAAACRHLRHVRDGAVDAQQLPPRHQPRRDDPPGRRDAEPDLRLRHPLPVEDRGRDQRRASSTSSTGSVAVPTGPGLGVELDRDAARRRCTSSTSPAASAGARTPSTCGRSSRTSRPTPARW